MAFLVPSSYEGGGIYFQKMFKQFQRDGGERALSLPLSLLFP